MTLLHSASVLKLLLLLSLANGMPVVAKKILARRWSGPLDFGVTLRDGHPLFGASKTLRGVVLAVAVTAAAAPVLGLGWATGALVGAAAMAGDLLSSFCKRRLKLPPSSRAPVIDQVPEALLPALAAIGPLGLDAADVAAVVVLFFAGEVVLSRLLFRLHLRDQPY